MDRELIDHVWKHCLPKEFKEEVKKEWCCIGSSVAKWTLEYLFGKYNLTSDAEGEEILTVPRKKVQEKWQRAYEQEAKYSQAQDSPVAREELYYNRGILSILDTLFGSKCLPDAREVNFVTKKSQPAEPKFNLGDKAILKGHVCTITSRVYEQGKFVGYKIESPLLHGDATVPESDLEPYAKPVGTKSDTKDDTKDPTFTDECKSQCKSTDRLRIAAMLAAGMLASEVRCYPVDRALGLADKLIAECEKGGE